MYSLQRSITSFSHHFDTQRKPASFAGSLQRPSSSHGPCHTLLTAAFKHMRLKKDATNGACMRLSLCSTLSSSKYSVSHICRTSHLGLGSNTHLASAGIATAQHEQCNKYPGNHQYVSSTNFDHLMYDSCDWSARRERSPSRSPSPRRRSRSRRRTRSRSGSRSPTSARNGDRSLLDMTYEDYLANFKKVCTLQPPSSLEHTWSGSGRD